MQGIIAGVGFLGGGVILRGSDADTVEPGHHRKKVRGLTTAASVWVAAALGIACGAGQWPSALIALGFTLLVLVVGGPLEGAIHRTLHGHPEEDAAERPPIPPRPADSPRL